MGPTSGRSVLLARAACLAVLAVPATLSAGVAHALPPGSGGLGAQSEQVDETPPLDGATTTTAPGPQTGFFGVLRFEGEPVEGVEIAVSRNGEEVATAVTDADGRYEAVVPEPGTYEVTIVEESLPEDVGLRNPDRATLELEARPGRLRPAAFPLGEGGAGARSTLERGLDLAVDGVKLGSILALASIGLSLVFGVTGLVNFAHGEMLTFGAVVAWYFNVAGSGPSIHLVTGALVAVALGAVLGGAQERVLWRPLRQRRAGLIAMLVISIGLSLFLRNLFLLFFGGGSRRYRNYAVQPVWEWGPVSLPPKDVFIIVVSLTLLVAIGVALLKTRLGTAIRAVADSPDLAEASGIDVQRVLMLIWVAGGALTALAGVFQGVTQAVSFNMGFALLLLIFAAVILGGLGTAFGAVVGALVVGIAIQVSTLWIDTEFKEVVALGILIVFLLFRPQGLLGQRERVG